MLCGSLLPAGFCAFEAFGRVGQCGFIVAFGADHGVWANDHALSALDAQVFFPNGRGEGETAFFPLCGTEWVGSVDGKGADGELVAFSCDHRGDHVLYKLRSAWRDHSR